MKRNTDCFEIKDLFKDILISLFSLNKFDNKYQILYPQLCKIFSLFTLQLDLDCVLPRKELLDDLNTINFNNYDSNKLMETVGYTDSDTVLYIFSNNYSYFSDFSIQEKIFMIFCDLCARSSLNTVFHSNLKNFSLKDFYSLIKSVLGFNKSEFKNTLKKSINRGLVKINKTQITLTDKWYDEISRLFDLSKIPETDLNDFDATSELFNTAKHPYTSIVTGYYAPAYILSKANKAKIRLWYVQNLDTFYETVNYLCNSEEEETIWLNYFDFPKLECDSVNLALTNLLKISVIISGNLSESFFEIFPEISVKYNENFINHRIDIMFEPDLANEIKKYLKNVSSINHKDNLIEQLNFFVARRGTKNVLENLPNFFENVKNDINREDEFQEKKEEEEHNNEINKSDKNKTMNTYKEKIISAINEDDFINRYDFALTPCAENDITSKKILEIHKKLSAPCSYLKCDKELFNKFDDLMNKHPNILNKELLYSYVKNTILFSKDNILRTTPLFLLGSPGCGKSMLCRELRTIFGQDKDIFIPMATGLGVGGLMGSTPEYKGASNGLILSSIWNSMNNVNCLNSIIVLDELDKASLSLTGERDANQNVLATLLQLFSDENMNHFKDNFFDLPIYNFFPNFFATGNSIDNIPEPLLDRLTIIRFRDYTSDEFKNIVIPKQYELFKQNHQNLSDSLSEDEIDFIFKLSNGKTRKIRPAIDTFLAASYDIDCKKRKLNNSEIEDLINRCSENKFGSKQIGFNI